MTPWETGDESTADFTLLELLERIVETGRPVHYVHISTAYTAGRRRGAIPEASVEHTVDWRTEAEAGMAMKARIEEQSRSAPMLAKFRKDAEKLLTATLQSDM